MGRRWSQPLSGPLNGPLASGREIAVVAAAFTVFTLLWTYPLALSLGRALPGALGDELLNTWILAWDADRLRHGLQGWWDAPILFPYAHTLAFSEHLLGVAILVAPVAWISGNPVLAYDVAFLLSFVIAGSGMYLLARSLSGRRDAAVVAALAFVCCPYRMDNLAHLQVLTSGWMPMALWGLHEYLDAGARRCLVWFAMAFLMQALSNGYFLYFFTLPVAIVIMAAALEGKLGGMRRVVELVAAFAIILTVLAPIGVGYHQARDVHDVRRDLGEIHRFSADVLSYLWAPRTNWLWGRFGVFRAEGALFPGLTIVALAAIGVVGAALWPRSHTLRSRRLAASYGAVAILAWLFSLGPRPTLSGRALLPVGPHTLAMAVVPGFDAMRVPARFATVVYVALGVLGSIGAAWLFERLRPAGRRAAVGALASAIVAEGVSGGVPSVRFDPRGRQVDRAVSSWIGSRPPGAVLHLLDGGAGSVGRACEVQYQTLFHRHPLVNGYTGFVPALQRVLSRDRSLLTDPASLGSTVSALSAIGLRYLVVYGREHQEAQPPSSLVAAIRASMPIAEEAAVDDAHIFRFQERRNETVDRRRAEWRPIASSTFRGRASSNPEQLGNAFDGRSDSLWTTGRRQRGGEAIEIEFDRPRDVAFVRMEWRPMARPIFPKRCG